MCLDEAADAVVLRHTLLLPLPYHRDGGRCVGGVRSQGVLGDTRAGCCSPTKMYLILPLLLIRLLSAAAAETDTGQPPDESVQALVEWLTAGGAYLAAVRVGVGEAGYRGVLAATHINKGEVILRIPLNKAINTGPMSITASEAAVKLLRETHKKRATRRAYVGALPPRSECTTLDGWDQKSLAHLPAALVAAALQRQKWATKVFDRDVKGKQKLFGGQEISWEEFVHGERIRLIRVRSVVGCLVSASADARATRTQSAAS